MVPANSGDGSQYQHPLYQYDQPYPGMPTYLASPETTPTSLSGNQGPFGPIIDWGDYPSGIHTPQNNLYYV